MWKRSIFLLAAAGGLAAAAPAAAEQGYLAVNGLKMYYQVEGAGRPLVLLHGGVCTIEACMGPMRTILAKQWKTIAVEQQAHGRTADIDRPLSYDQMTEDTAAALRALKIENADVFGYSMGGAIAIRLAIKHPQLVRKVAIFGSGYAADGMIPGLAENMKKMKPDDIPAEFRAEYTKVAPNPAGWPTLVEKIKGLVANAKDVTDAEIKSIKAPLLVMVGDADIVTPEHALKMFRLLPHGQLAVLPVSNHFAPVQRADWVVQMVKAFFEAPMPK